MAMLDVSPILSDSKYFYSIAFANLEARYLAKTHWQFWAKRGKSAAPEKKVTTIGGRKNQYALGSWIQMPRGK